MISFIIIIKMQTDIVIGLQYGDEGKGKVVNNYINKNGYNTCVRFNGGPNAGHTVYFNDKKLVTHQVPTGAIHGMKSLIGASCMVDPKKLDIELRMIEEAGVTNIRDLVKISEKCHVIKQEHIEYDKSNNVVGTTGCGMGPAYVDKYNRKGLQIINYIGDGFSVGAMGANGNKQVYGCELVDPIDNFCFQIAEPNCGIALGYDHMKSKSSRVVIPPAKITFSILFGI